MKNFIKILLIIVTLGTITSCAADNGGKVDKNPREEEKSDNFVMKATVTNVNDKIEINVYEAEYAEGIYWLVTDDKTQVVDASGSLISLSDIKSGDNITVEYSGQVMMSYPPQVYAIKIVKL